MEDIENDELEILVLSETDEKMEKIRYGKGNSKYPKSDYDLYEATKVVTRVKKSCVLSQNLSFHRTNS